MNLIKTTFKELKYFLILWSTQALSQLGSSMTNYALIVWSYTAKGSALTTALLSVCSYAPYVIMSVFSFLLSDKWNKKITNTNFSTTYKIKANLLSSKFIFRKL